MKENVSIFTLANTSLRFDLALFYLFIRRVRKTLYHDPNSQYTEKKTVGKQHNKYDLSSVPEARLDSQSSVMVRVYCLGSTYIQKGTRAIV